LRARLALTVTLAMIAVYLLTAVPLIEAFGMDGAALLSARRDLPGALLRRIPAARRFGRGPAAAAQRRPAARSAVAWSRRWQRTDTLPRSVAGGSRERARGGAGGIRRRAPIWQRATGESLRLTGFRAA
jgi:hypothetical protein